MKIGIAQMNSIVGDLSFNADEIISRYQDLVSSGADLVITPELSVTGYPPRDLIFRSKFIDDNLKVIEKIAEKVGNVPIVVGCIDYNTQNTGNPFENAACLLYTSPSPRDS